jgi:RNA polymerase sigma-70 factor (ECF subfamily)
MHQHAGELRDAARVGPWAFRIARNVVVDHLRRRRVHAPIEGNEELVLPEEPSNLNDRVGAWFRSMLSMLPEDYRQALELTELEGLTQRELAERMGLSLSGAKSRVQRARKMLEGLFRACCHFELDKRGNVIACSPRARRACKDC